MPGGDRPTTRRALLAAVAGLAGTAGCLHAPIAGDPGGRGANQAPATGDGRGTTTGERPLARHGTPATICEEEPGEDPGIYAVTDPAFGEDWAGLDVDGRYGALAADTTVVGVERDGETRAYPLPVLTFHEVVNDDLGGPLLVTYCPLCKSGLVAERRVDGVATTFRVTGLLWRAPRIQSAAAVERGDVFGAGTLDPGTEPRNRGNLVMADDRTGSYWSQILARAICGPARGDRLTAVAATTTTWREWRDDHPETRVLLPPPVSKTDA